MASFADLRPIIVITVFLSLFIFFISMLATTPEIWSASTQTQRIIADETFEASRLFYWNMTNGTIINHADGWTVTGRFGDVEAKIYTYNSWQFYPIVQIDSFYTWSWGVSYQHDFEHFIWYYKNDTNCEHPISHDQSEDPNYVFPKVPWEGLRIYDIDRYYWENPILSSLQFKIKNSRTSSTVTFSFNETMYGGPQAAWLDDQLYISFANNWSQSQTGMNAFALIGGLLFWSLPGVPTEIYLIVSFIIWPPIVYVAAIWILRLIGSVMGGGASG